MITIKPITRDTKIIFHYVRYVQYKFMRSLLVLFFLVFLFSSCDTEIEENILSELISNEEPKIAIQPFGSIDTSYINAVKTDIEKYYGLEVRVLPSKILPTMSHNTGVAKATGLSLPLRYRADSLLRYLSRNIPEDCQFVIGITNQDISTSNKDENHEIIEPVWLNADGGIFGLGQLPGEVCVVSLYRINNPYSAEISKKRLSKVAKHELGHNLGLEHCENSCFMHEADLSNAIVALDAEVDSLCTDCKNILKNKYNYLNQAF